MQWGLAPDGTTRPCVIGDTGNWMHHTWVLVGKGGGDWEEQ